MKRIEFSPIIVHEFKDLNEAARDKAILSMAHNWNLLAGEDEEALKRIERSVRESALLSTPWFLDNIIAKNHRNEIIKELEEEDYCYDGNGEVLPVLRIVNGNGKLLRAQFNGKYDITIKDHNPQSEGDVQS